MIEIHKKDYQKILKEVQFVVGLAQKKILRNKVEMAWQIGKIIEESLPKSDKEKYGQKLIEQLESDVLINRTVLYRMHSFYQTYPQLPKDDSKLNWSHYRVLAGIKEKSERKALENLAKENLWSGEELQRQKALFEKEGGAASAAEGDLKKGSDPKGSDPIIAIAKIQPNRGKLFTYKIVEVIGSNKKFFDCGFGICREVKEPLPHDAQMVLIKEGKAIKSATKPQQVYTFKAYLKRVVDGDTLHAIIDSGFGIFHDEIIRLAKINTAEAKSEEGNKAKEELKKILESVPFFILKSIKTDIFNRYVADIFLPEKGETDLQKIADKGVYLNQLLLDRGLAEVF